jgi:hypothetical protein
MDPALMHPADEKDEIIEELRLRPPILKNRATGPDQDDL